MSGPTKVTGHRISGPRGVAIVKRFEGLGDGDESTPELEPYHDPAGYPTIGYGHLLSSEKWADLRLWKAISKRRAEQLLKIDMHEAELRVCEIYEGAGDLHQWQFDALVSFVFNVGSGNFARSTLLKKLRRGDHVGVLREFPKWRRAGGKILPGLVRRRAAEAALYEEGLAQKRKNQAA